MATRNIVLTDAQEELVRKLVASGRFQNASEVLRAGLRHLEREEVSLDALRAELAAAHADAVNGDFAEGTGAEAVKRAFATARKR